VVTETRLFSMSQDGQSRDVVLREFATRVACAGWLDGAVPRTVIHVGTGGRSAVTVETARGLAVAAHERSPALRLEVLDPAGHDEAWNGFSRLAVDPDDTVEVSALRGVALKVPRVWFEPFFLITVAAVHPDRRWRIGGVLQAQAELLAYLNPGAPASVLLCEAHRLGAPDLAVAWGAHGTGEVWWTASPSDVLVDGSVAHAAGLDPRDLPSIRAIARHELLEAWAEAESGAAGLRGMGRGAVWSSLLETRERGAAAARRVCEDVNLITRNLRKVPHALRRHLATRMRARASV